jgi:hypothetical protein
LLLHEKDSYSTLIKAKRQQFPLFYSGNYCIFVVGVRAVAQFAEIQFTGCLICLKILKITR